MGIAKNSSGGRARGPELGLKRLEGLMRLSRIGNGAGVSAWCWCARRAYEGGGCFNAAQ